MGIWNAMECWFLQRLVLGTRSPVGILALPFRPLYSNMSRLSFLLFLRLSHLSCSRMPVILPEHGWLLTVDLDFLPQGTILFNQNLSRIDKDKWTLQLVVENFHVSTMHLLTLIVPLVTRYSRTPVYITEAQLMLMYYCDIWGKLQNHPQTKR